jgi:UDP-N-acetylglucosamine 2-epimerase (non-hydrolysing)
MTIVGTRPELIKMSRVLAKFDELTNHVLVHTGQNYDYELNEIFFHDLRIRKPNFFLNAVGSTAAETIGQIIAKSDEIMRKEMPDALLLYGDTNSCLSVISAKRLKIPVFHMEAVNRCFDMSVPEEINRRIIDHTADINLTYSTIARNYLLREGLSPDMVIKTGSPMNEVLNYYRPQIELSQILDRLGLFPEKYIVVSAHREENIEPDKNFKNLINVINLVADYYSLPVIVSTHPRTRARINLTKVQFHPGVRLLKPLNFSDYNKLQLFAKVVLSDSGTINEESSILNFPALNLRESNERPEAIEEAAVMMVGLNAARVLQCIKILDQQPRGANRLLCLVADYSMPNVSDKIVRIIHSYTDYVNRVVWKKY